VTTTCWVICRSDIIIIITICHAPSFVHLRLEQTAQAPIQFGQGGFGRLARGIADLRGRAPATNPFGCVRRSRA
jgi:hypothetical protein